MGSNKYKVLVCGCVVAENMYLEMTLLLVKAILQENQNVPSTKVSIEEMERTEGECNAR
ncbi:MAG: hypothetical protein U0M06_12715 [Clostridia bacterium]|nr:hypothetical protein [Clostridia bacterium]